MSDEFKVQFGIEFDLSDIESQVSKVNQSIKSKKIKIQAEVDDSQLSNSINKSLNKLTNLNNATVRLNRLDTSQLDSTLNKKITEIKTKIETLGNNAKLQINLNDGINTKLSSDIDKAIAEYKNLYSEVNKVKSATLDLSNRSKSLTNIESYMANNSKAVSQYGAKLNNLKERMEKATSNIEVANLNKEFVTLRKEIEATGNSGKTLGDTLKNNISKFGDWIIAGTVFMGVQNGIQNTISSIRELDTSMVELKKVTDESNESYTNFYYNANELAKELGTSTKELISSTATWAQMGYGLKDAAELAKASAIMDTISPEMNLEESTDGMIAAIKAFDIEAEDALDGVASKVNLIGNEFALTNTDVIEALKRSGAALADANNSIDQSIALMIPAIETTRDAASVGQALKTIQARIRGVNEETGVLDGSLQTIKGDLYDITGVEVYEANTGELRSTYDIISDIADVYKSLNDKQKYEVLDLLGGKRQINQVSALLNNFETSREALEKLGNSAGNAETEFKKAQESIDYRMNKLAETGIGISQNILNTDFFKFIVDSLTAVGEAIDFVTEKSGGLGTIFGLLGGVAGAKGLGWLKCLRRYAQLKPKRELNEYFIQEAFGKRGLTNTLVIECILDEETLYAKSDIIAYKNNSQGLLII